jgi:chaperonin cofactor prefoldin
MEHDMALEVDWPVTYASERCDEFQPPPVQQTNELAVIQVQLARVVQENADLRQALQEAETTLRELRRVIVDTEASEGDG